MHGNTIPWQSRISWFSTYRGLESADPKNMPNAHKMADSVICLPLHYEFSDIEIETTLVFLKKIITMTKQDLYNAIDEHLRKSNRQYYREFYCGITDNVDRRLFDEHNVSKANGFWIYGPADSVEDAREVEKHYLDLGMQGAGGGGNENTVWVYCYLIMQYTKEGV